MNQRRNLLKTFIAATIASSIPRLAISSPTNSASRQISGHTAKQIAWKNWSGNLSAMPAARQSVTSVEELQVTLKKQSQIRVVGAGHSFSPLVPTSETMLSMRGLNGLVNVQDDLLRGEIAAGTTLKQAALALNKVNQAFINMPDIDQQTLGGAISTATHGTGAELGCLSAYVRELEIVTADGTVRRCNKNTNTELFEAARVGLGAMGVITGITMQNQRPFNLVRRAAWLSFEEAVEQAQAMANKHRNFEFYTIPFTGMVLSDTLDITEEAASPKSEIDSNDGLMQLKDARDYLSWSPTLRRLILGSYMKTIKPEQNVDRSYSIYATERNVRFNEMEYHLPIDKGMEALIQIKELIEKRFPEVFFPIECRFVKADDCWLSPFYGRDTISIAVHRYFEEDYKPLFAAIEPILREFKGRPHWGKINTFTYQDFEKSYEKWGEFLSVRQEYDPKGIFLNDYLRKTFGL